MLSEDFSRFDSINLLPNQTNTTDYIIDYDIKFFSRTLKQICRSRTVKEITNSLASTSAVPTLAAPL